MFLNRAFTMVSLVGGVVAIILSLLSGEVLFPLIAAMFFTLSLLLWKYGYIIIPLFTRATNVIEVHGGYEVPSTRDHIVKKTDNGYYASKFLEVKFYESSMEKDASGNERAGPCQPRQGGHDDRQQTKHNFG